MSGATDSSYPADWLEVARRDWRRVHMLLSAGDAELAAYLLEQCLEKYLKAYLLERGWQLRRTHLLARLLDEAAALDRRLETYKVLCERVSGYLLVGRYPLLGVAKLELEQVRDDAREARGLIQALYPDEGLG